ncbi:unnamed protein product [Rotaria sp. Silwood1]|nr:unnamed protein product [Rotaria sp. Silwood1]CAF1265599.1 unnamed protein product [Rotaria sp. Silwood1]
MGRDLFGIKFGAHLAAHLTPEWRSQYLQYEAMVAILYAAVDRAPSHAETTRNRYFSRIDERFFAYCNKELFKINVFFGEKLSESIRRFEQLRTELKYFKKHLTINESEQTIIRRRRQYRKILRSNYNHINDLKLAFSELYLLLVLLQNYQTLNYMGFKKILTKHDKLFHKINGIEWFKTNIDSSPFVSNQQVSNLIDEVEILVTDHLENVNRKKAMQKLRVPPLTHIHKGIVTYSLGLLNGLFIVLLINLFVIHMLTRYSYETTKHRKPIDSQTAIILYRSSLIFIIHLILIRINIIGWSSYGINHVLIFELDPCSHITHEEILEESHWQPMIFIFLIIFLLFNPLNIMHRSARYWFCKELFRIFSAPFHTVTFADFWLADQLTSLDIIFYDFEYLICYFAFDAQWIKNQSK